MQELLKIPSFSDPHCWNLLRTVFKILNVYLQYNPQNFIFLQKTYKHLRIIYSKVENPIFVTLETSLYLINSFVYPHFISSTTHCSPLISLEISFKTRLIHIFSFWNALIILTCHPSKAKNKRFSLKRETFLVITNVPWPAKGHHLRWIQKRNFNIVFLSSSENGQKEE